MRYLTHAVKSWIEDDREARAASQLALHILDPERFARESETLLSVLQHAEPGTTYLLHVSDEGEALLVKQ